MQLECLWVAVGGSAALIHFDTFAQSHQEATQGSRDRRKGTKEESRLLIAAVVVAEVCTLQAVSLRAYRARSHPPVWLTPCPLWPLSACV